MKAKLLSHVHGLGRVCRCAHCPDLHLSIGPVDIRLPEGSLEDLATLITQAAAELSSEKAQKIYSGQGHISCPAPRWILS
jgi:hypothetical protein